MRQMKDSNEIYIEYDACPNQEKTSLLTTKLSEIASEKKRMPPIREFAFFLMQNNNIVGGVCGCIYYGCLYIDELWVDEKLRCLRYGTDLMRKAKQLARDEQCLFCTVDTMDWEAKDFYLKLGFEVEFERNGYLQNSTKYMLRKNL